MFKIRQHFLNFLPWQFFIRKYNIWSIHFNIMFSKSFMSEFLNLYQKMFSIESLLINPLFWIIFKLLSEKSWELIWSAIPLLLKYYLTWLSYNNFFLLFWNFFQVPLQLTQKHLIRTISIYKIQIFFNIFLILHRWLFIRTYVFFIRFSYLYLTEDNSGIFDYSKNFEVILYQIDLCFQCVLIPWTYFCQFM